MRICTAGELQKNFKAGLIIVGENNEGELEWMGTDKQWMKTIEELTSEQDIEF